MLNWNCPVAKALELKFAAAVAYTVNTALLLVTELTLLVTTTS